MEVVAAIIKQDEKYLICQRASDDECGLLWEFPGGKVELGETLEEGIIREIREELKLSIEVLNIFAKTVYHFKGKEINFTFFQCQIIEGEMELSVHKAINWVTAEEMKTYSFMPADIEVIALI